MSDVKKPDAPSDNPEQEFFRDGTGADPSQESDADRLALALHRWKMSLVRAVIFGALALGLGVAVLLWLGADLGYFFERRTPADLGNAEELPEQALATNRFVRIRGVARDMCIRAETFRRTVRYLYLMGSAQGGRILIEAPAGMDEKCEGAEDRTFEGRLMDLSGSRRYERVLKHYRDNFPAAPKDGPLYLLQDAVLPPSTWWTLLMAALVVCLWAVNARVLVRLRRARRKLQTQGEPS